MMRYVTSLNKQSPSAHKALKESALIILSVFETILVVALVFAFMNEQLTQATLAIGGSIGLFVLVLMLLLIINAIVLGYYLGVIRGG